MSDETQGGAPKKLSTKDILAAARAAAAAQSGAADSSAETPAESAPVASAESAPPPAAAAGKPKSTSDILAAARAAAAQKAAGGEAPAEAAKPAAPKPAAAAGGAKPKSTADILAAARAAKAGGTAPGAAAAPAAGDKPAPAKKPAAAAKGTATAEVATGLSVQEMLAAVRPANVAAAAPVEEKKPAKVAPPMPAKPQPAAAKKGAAPDAERRFFLLALLASPFALAWIMLSGAATAALLGVARFMLPNVLTEPPRKFKIGPPSDYDLGTVATKWVAAYGIWIVHTDQYKGKNLIYALASVCTHLGCTPSWLEGEQKFKCPCHGSGFYITGVNFEGPAPRPLERVGLRLAEDGMLEVDKSLKFQEEMGQWEDPNSYYEPVA